ncbi:hypothetical protein WA588_001323, partial [Blastocystis sp. NMH]
MNPLSENSLANSASLPSIDGLTLQIVSVKLMNGDQKTMRYLFMLSDGSSAVRALSSGPIVDKIQSGEIRKNTVVRILASRKVRESAFYITDMMVVQQRDAQIGNPVISSSSRATAPAPVAAPSYPQQPSYQQPQQPSYQPPQQSYQQPQQSYQPPQQSYQQPQQSYQPPQQSYQPPQQSYQQPQQPYQQAPRSGGSGGNYTVDTSRFNQVPISAIHPYLDRNWFIRCRVTSKSAVRSFHSQRGEGKLFNADLLDAEGSEIRIAFFNESVDLFFDFLQQGHVYDICNVKVSFANRRYNPLKNEYELSASRFTQIQEAPDSGIQQQHYVFTPIAQVASLDPHKTVDILGIVESHEPVTEFRSRKGNEMKRKQFSLLDASNTSIHFTVFGQNAMVTDDRLADHPVMAIKNAIVSDFGGHSLSGFDSTSFVLNPDLPEARALQQWYATRGDVPTVSLSTAGQPASDPLRRKTLAGIAEERLGFGERADFVTVKAMVRNIPHDREVYYPSCGSVGADGRKCQKKVTQTPEGVWACEACGKTVETPSYRYVLNMELMDFTGSSYVSMFNDDAEKLLGVTAAQLKTLNETNKEEYDNVFKRVLFKEYVFRLRVKMENSPNYEARVRCSVQQFSPVDESKEVEDMIAIIENL